MTISIVKNMTIKLQSILPASNTFTKFQWGDPCEGDKYRWGIKISNGTNFNDIE